MGRKNGEKLRVNSHTILAERVQLFRKFDKRHWWLLIWIEIIPKRIGAFENIQRVSNFGHGCLC